MDESTVRSIANSYAEILRNIIKGAEIEYVGESWDDIGAGNVAFESQGWKFTIFNDCDSLDYTDEVTSPAGVKLDFDMMFDNQCDPVCYMPMNVDLALLEKTLKLATRKVEESK